MKIDIVERQHCLEDKKCDANKRTDWDFVGTSPMKRLFPRGFEGCVPKHTKFKYKLERNRWLPFGFVSQTGED